VSGKPGKVSGKPGNDKFYWAFLPTEHTSQGSGISLCKFLLMFFLMVLSWPSPPHSPDWWLLLCSAATRINQPFNYSSQHCPDQRQSASVWDKGWSNILPLTSFSCNSFNQNTLNLALAKQLCFISFFICLFHLSSLF
jgi:hypothetical protein